MDISKVFLLEISWEVCRQIGGIYRVIRTKAPVISEYYKDNYCLIGPDIKGISDLEFEEIKPYGIYKDIIEDITKKGILIRFGKWLITGSPNVILIDFLAYFYKIQEYKYFFWKDHGIETPDEMWINDSVIFGYQAADVIESFTKILNKKPVIAHFHEWNVGSTIPILRKRNIPVKIVFTTHATLLGRYMASHVENIYEHIKYVNPYEEAKKYNIFSHYLIERAACYGAHIFTTVSEITAEETKYLLQKEVDFITPNGLNINRFVIAHEHQNLHGLYKSKIHQFVAGYFFPYYTFDLDKTLYFFTSGRYEFRNKGIDLFLDALPILNELLIENQIDINIVVFIITKTKTKGYRYDVLQNQFTYDELNHVCETIAEKIPHRLLNQIIESPEIHTNHLVDESEKMYLKRIYYSWKKEGFPSVVTHEMEYPDDIILSYIYKNNITNKKESKVKIIYHPDFLSSFGSIVKLDYLEFIRGCHLGIFPSYYEPWGYTPMECSAAGIPSITSDYTGFSLFLRKMLPEHEKYGLFILNRKNTSYIDCTKNLAEIMFQIARMNRRERIELRNRVESISEIFDWRNLIHYYFDAYQSAIQKV
ncbi:MAG: glycosyl transferase [Leptospiraceae bacterium]|nr:MAG: glycosyl transferase [Leptospiraceae bacterium]